MVREKFSEIMVDWVDYYYTPTAYEFERLGDGLVKHVSACHSDFQSCPVDEYEWEAMERAYETAYVEDAIEKEWCTWIERELYYLDTVRLYAYVEDEIEKEWCTWIERELYYLDTIGLYIQPVGTKSVKRKRTE